MVNKKSYYAIIPANVRYDKNLNNGSKLLYGEITALCNEKGFCWAGNGYFSGLYGVSERTIRRWFLELAENNYISIDISFDGEKSVRSIVISGAISDEFQEKKVSQMSGGGGQICPDPRTNMSKTPDKNVHYNSTVNNTINKRGGKIPPSVSLVSAYMRQRNKKHAFTAEGFVDFYTAKNWMIGKNKMVDWQAAIRTWEKKDERENRCGKSKTGADILADDLASHLATNR